ncbi:MAG: Flp pilus assembly protein CpaB [Deltaproteobacteria bacterium]|nr:Flp pilus assembly protein CpaB [Deltaproteobacteria bacterium]
MSRNITIIFVVIALVLGFLAAVVAKRYIEQATAGGRGALVESDAVSVVVAKQDIPMAASLTAGDVRVEAVPRSIVPEGALTDPQAAVGRGAAAPIARGEVILEGRLTAEGVGGGLPGMITEGFRAITVKVNEVVGVAGFIVPGTFVDVLTTIRRREGDAEPETRMILQNIRVLAAGPYLERDRENKPVTVNAVTLEVTPEAAEMISHAQNEGELRLALRNRMDQEEVATPGVDTNFLLVGRQQTKTGGRGVEVVLGTEVTQQSF